MVSVIIPTYNRKVWLRETLNSLDRQSYPSNCFEVIVVDDGSTDYTHEIAAQPHPFTLRYFWQSNQGDAAARNLGAQQSGSDILVFLDDDILVHPDYLAYMIGAHDGYQNRIVVGTANLWRDQVTPLSQTLYAPIDSNHNDPIVDVLFANVCSNNMSLRREAYFEIGMMDGLGFSGSSMWCDVDLAYRAYQQGFEFRRSTMAQCWHRDDIARSLDRYGQRMRTAAYRAVVLFQKYPQLPSHLPMFDDKTPINWAQDPWLLIARKLIRQAASSHPALRSLEKTARILEKYQPASNFLRYLYRYIIGAYVFTGYREGLHDFGQIDGKDEPILLN